MDIRSVGSGQVPAQQLACEEVSRDPAYRPNEHLAPNRPDANAQSMHIDPIPGLRSLRAKSSHVATTVRQARNNVSRPGDHRPCGAMKTRENTSNGGATQ